jgi:hypothetical protein
MAQWKTITGTSGLATAQTLTITSPNTKCIFIKQYVIATYGAPSPDGITIQITDEDSNVLWEDAIAKSTGTLPANPMRVPHTFPDQGLKVAAGKNVAVVVSDPGAGSGTEASVLYTL